LKDAPILLLDEPTSALDPTTEAAIMETIKELMQGRTTLIVTHRLATIHFRPGPPPEPFVPTAVIIANSNGTAERCEKRDISIFQRGWKPPSASAWSRTIGSNGIANRFGRLT